MRWMPRDGMWLSYLNIDTTAGELTHDLAIDASGLDTTVRERAAATLAAEERLWPALAASS